MRELWGELGGTGEFGFVQGDDFQCRSFFVEPHSRVVSVAVPSSVSQTRELEWVGGLTEWYPRAVQQREVVEPTIPNHQLDARDPDDSVLTCLFTSRLMTLAPYLGSNPFLASQSRAPDSTKRLI